MKKILIMAMAAAALVLAACDVAALTEAPAEVTKTRRYHLPFKVDTLEIRGGAHEVVMFYHTYEYGVMHSPECWCLEDSTND